MSKFRLQMPRISEFARAYAAIGLKMMYGRKVYKVIKDSYTLHIYYELAKQLIGRPVVYLDFEEDYEFDLDKLLHGLQDLKSLGLFLVQSFKKLSVIKKVFRR